MRGILLRTLLISAAALLASACASLPHSGPQLSQDAPWWEKAGPCRVWVPIQPQPGRMPAWDPGPSTSRMSNVGDCRALQASMPGDAVLIGSRP